MSPTRPAEREKRPQRQTSQTSDCFADPSILQRLHTAVLSLVSLQGIKETRLPGWVHSGSFRPNSPSSQRTADARTCAHRARVGSRLLRADQHLMQQVKDIRTLLTLGLCGWAPKWGYVTWPGAHSRYRILYTGMYHTALFATTPSSNVGTTV